MRTSFFFGSSPFLDASAGGALAAGPDTAAPSDTGPFLSASSILAGSPPVRLFRFVSAQLLLLVSTRRCAVWPFVPPSTGDTDRASGYAVSNWKLSVIGCDG